jgi:nucleoid-associated protein YgaU
MLHLSTSRLWFVLSVLLLSVPVGATVAVQLVWSAHAQPAPPAVAMDRPTPIPSPSPTATSVPAISAEPSPSSVPTPVVYTVADGDTLRTIARRVYGDAAEWERVYSANRQAIGPDPNLLPVGTHLRLPAPGAVLVGGISSER